MNAEEAKMLLEVKGYTAFVENGVVLVAIATPEKMRKVHGDVRRILYRAGYIGSFGVRVVSV